MFSEKVAQPKKRRKKNTLNTKVLFSEKVAQPFLHLMFLNDLVFINHGNVCTFFLFTVIHGKVSQSTETTDIEPTPFPTEVGNEFWAYNRNTIIIFLMGVLVVMLIIAIVYLWCRGRNRRLTFQGSSGDQMMKGSYKCKTRRRHE